MKYLSDYTKDKQTKLYDKTGAFFAFSKEQFEDSKKEGIEYCHLFAGLICPCDTAQEVMAGLDKIQKEGIAQDIAENGKAAIIRRELFNHECFYTGDVTDCVEKLDGYEISKEEIVAVYLHICKTEDVD
ncbi:hypothetical protein MD535_24605 [Vibrio sp. ZSDZ65]|uniref:BCTnown n=1 Tax=Vibrio qingdaonensis TaxID=2829491 RepID=A0A9X3CSX5_9VIBR|nr:hypothetical protein [Vibrio qingdaonensis]MCW8349172.1 hypothetical protein [Vibrio qingdaonensis]